MPHKDPKRRLEMELGPEVFTLQELCPGMHTQVPSQKRAESGCKLRPCQLLDSKLAGANKAKVMSQPASLMLGMSPVRLPFCEGKTFPSEPSQKFLDKQKKGPQETTCKHKILLYKRLLTPLDACPQMSLLRNESKGTIPPCTQFAIGQEIPPSYIVK
jgi:hypothetical protein